MNKDNSCPCDQENGPLELPSTAELSMHLLDIVRELKCVSIVMPEILDKGNELPYFEEEEMQNSILKARDLLNEAVKKTTAALEEIILYIATRNGKNHE